MTTIEHPLAEQDRATMAQIAQAAAPAKGHLERGAFDQVMEQTPQPTDVDFEAGVVGGVDGWWVRPEGAAVTPTILYLHGGAYIVGSAKSYCNFVGQIARAAGVCAFVPDYRLAPEHPFPAAVEDAAAVCADLARRSHGAIALVGDSAGGGLALSLLALTTSGARNGGERAPITAAVMSPWTDLALTGPTLKSNAEVDPFLTRAALQSAADQYLGSTDPRDPRASPLYSWLDGLPPVQIHVGEAEILLDDARRYAQRVNDAGGELTLHQWAGMPHVFLSSIGVLSTAQPAIDTVARFLRDAFEASPSTETKS